MSRLPAEDGIGVRISARAPRGSSSLCEIGRVRTINADALRVDNRRGFYALADGVGSTTGSAEASRFVVDEAHRLFGATVGLDPGAPCDLIDLILEVSANFRAHFSHTVIPATTLTLARVRGSRLDYASVGDSPVVFLEDGRATLLTRDHTVADRGKVVRDFSALKMMGCSNVLFTSIGRLRPQPVSYPALTWPRDARLLLCSDGLFDFVSQGDLAAMSAEAVSRAHFLRSIRARAATSACRDNYSLILIDLPGGEEV